MAGSAPPPGAPPPLDWDVDLGASLNAVFEDCLDLLGPYADAETANMFAEAPAKAPAGAAKAVNPANAFPSGGAGPSRLVPTPGLWPWQQLEPVPEHAKLDSKLASSEWEALNLLPLADVDDLSLPPPGAHAGLPALLLDPAGRAEPSAAQSPRGKLKAAKQTPPGSPRVKFR